MVWNKFRLRLHDTEKKIAWVLRLQQLRAADIERIHDHDDRYCLMLLCCSAVVVVFSVVGFRGFGSPAVDPSSSSPHIYYIILETSSRVVLFFLTWLISIKPFWQKVKIWLIKIIVGISESFFLKWLEQSIFLNKEKTFWFVMYWREKRVQE